MIFFKYCFWFLWRVWFYVVMAVPIIVMFPFLLASIITESGYPYFFRMAKIWARFILFFMGFRYKIQTEETLDFNTSAMLVANHTSMMDIMLLLAIIKTPFVFVGKQELSKIPLFGFFYKRTCILVDRGNAKSRLAVFEKAQKRIKSGLSICIFPEGGIPNEGILLDEFKDGAFRLAIEHQIPIFPITFGDNKRRFPYKFFGGSPGIMRIKLHKKIPTFGKTDTDRKILKEQTREVILNQIHAFASGN